MTILLDDWDKLVLSFHEGPVQLGLAKYIENTNIISKVRQANPAR